MLITTIIKIHNYWGGAITKKIPIWHKMIDLSLSPNFINKDTYQGHFMLA